MRIISQDKCHSVDFEHIHLWRQHKAICADIGEKNVEFGIYESDERAAEVFEGIHNAYSDVGFIARNMEPEVTAKLSITENAILRGVILTGGDGSVEVTGNFIYRMPEK
jgi:hypothetical protein